MAAPSKALVRTKLEISQLDQSAIQRELMGKDLSLKDLLVYFKSKIQFDAVERVIDARISRTIEGASTLTITLIDPDREVLNSGILANRLDINVDGLWFRLTALNKPIGSDRLELTFEDREIAILRTYKDKKIRAKPSKIAKRARATRAEFVLNLIREVKEFKIPVTIPELHIVQAIEKLADMPSEFEIEESRATGISYDAASPTATKHGVPEGTTSSGGPKSGKPLAARFVPGVTDFPTGKDKIGNAQGALTVKGVRASRTQIDNANIILSVASSMGAPRKVLVCAIMTAIQESTLINLEGGDLDSVGLFQQRGNGAWGTLRDRMDPATSARMFLLKALKAHANDPTRPYWDLCQAVQISAFPLAYADHRTEAERFVTAFGVVGGDTEGDSAGSNNSWSPEGDAGDYFFYRGDPQDGGKTWKPEDSWACIQRLADEVDWRAFFVSGRFYFIAEDELFKSKPTMVIHEYSDGVEGIGGDYDSGKESATATVRCRVGRWTAPPGSVVVLRDMGVWNGRWLVTNFERSLFESTADITIKKPRPRLPEPSQNAIDQDAVGGWGSPSTVYPDPDQALFGGFPGTDGSDDAVLIIAERAYRLQATDPYNYEQVRPYPATLWSRAAHDRGIDCSSFVTLVYKEAGRPDPNNNGYNGAGNTTTLAAHGLAVAAPNPGDLVFYGGTSFNPGHVAIYIGHNTVIEIGSDKGVLKVDMNYRSDIVGFRSYPF